MLAQGRSINPLSARGFPLVLQPEAMQIFIVRVSLSNQEENLSTPPSGRAPRWRFTRSRAKELFYTVMNDVFNILKSKRICTDKYIQLKVILQTCWHIPISNHWLFLLFLIVSTYWKLITSVTNLLVIQSLESCCLASQLLVWKRLA